MSVVWPVKSRFWTVMSRELENGLLTASEVGPQLFWNNIWNFCGVFLLLAFSWLLYRGLNNFTGAYLFSFILSCIWINSNCNQFSVWTDVLKTFYLSYRSRELQVISLYFWDPLSYNWARSRPYFRHRHGCIFMYLTPCFRPYCFAYVGQYTAYRRL